MMATGSREASPSSSTLVPSVIIETSVDSCAKSLRRKMHRAPPSLQLKQQHHQQHRDHYVYEPMVVSLGPCHHGKPHLQQVEEYKEKSLAMFVSPDDIVFFANMIAFEMSPRTRVNLTITSYINFMKTLIESSKDVKEHKEKGLLFSNLGNDEEVVKVFQEIDTFGVDSVYLFNDVKMKIEKHGNNKAKAWMAELIHTYFRNPWTGYCFARCHFYPCLNIHPNLLHRLAWLT